jgi:hypothetical protein
MNFAMRSFFDPAGFKYSSLARMRPAEPPRQAREFDDRRVANRVEHGRAQSCQFPS